MVYVRKIRSRTYEYFQLVESYREQGKVKTRVLAHLGEHQTPESALTAWPDVIAKHRRAGRDVQADKLAAKLEKLQALMEKQERRQSIVKGR